MPTVRLPASHGSNSTDRRRYRPDIDGLRAIAVLAVIGSHAGVSWLAGGFTGVDIFFVISGYLICGIIFREIAAGTFSVARFYERRIRRILPALLVMLFAVTVLASWLLLPGELIRFARTLLATLFSGSNFVFWREAGYFDTNAIFKPLQHTWSLGVEEQFYLLLPPFLLLLALFSSRTSRILLIATAAVSFAVSVYLCFTDSISAFYLAPLRAWELLVGALISGDALPKLRTRTAREAASLGGLALILLPIYFLRDTRFFPGALALPSCLGAALIIAAGETGPSLAGRVLSLRPIVFIGLISYSVYLWHWPLFVFQHTDLLFVPGRLQGQGITTPILVALSLLLGYLSWRFIEQPFRSRPQKIARRTVLILTGSGTLALTTAALAVILTHGLPQRFPPPALAMSHYLDFEPGALWRQDTCFITPAVSVTQYQSDVCLAQHPDHKSLLLAGDSHAASLYPGLLAALPDYDILQANVSACTALLHEPAQRSRNCHNLFGFVFDDYLLHHHVDILLLAGEWQRPDFPALGETIAWAHQHHINVIIAGDNLDFDAPLPRLLAAAMRHARGDRTVLPLSAAQQAATDADLATLARNTWHAPYISYFAAFCQPDCPLYATDGVPITFDKQHLTLEASARYAAVIKAAIQP